MYSIIYNEISGNGAAIKLMPKIIELLEEKKIGYRLDVSKKKGDMTLLAAKAVNDKLDGIIGIGGDGSFFDIANGIKDSGIELIFVPCGTGNDFMKMFSMPKEPIQALKTQLGSPVRYIDMCRCNDRYFLNVLGVGFDVDVLLRADNFRGKITHKLSYFLGAYSAIRDLKMLHAEITVDNEKPFDCESTIVSVGNGTFIGGGMKALPGARVDDGLLNVSVAAKVNKFNILYLLILFMLGKHVNHKKLIRQYSCKSIRIRSKGMRVEADGEIFDCEDANISILHNALKTRLPA